MYRWQRCLYLVLFAGTLSAQEWRPVSQVPASENSGIKLGKPRSATVENYQAFSTQPLPRDAVKFQTANYQDLKSLPEPSFNFPGAVPSDNRPATMLTRYQGPSAAEEAYNCGQIPGQAPVGGAPAGVPPPYGAAPPPYGAPPPFGAPPPGAPAPTGASTPWYQPVKDCWNKVFGTGQPGGAHPFSTWDARSDQGFKDFISPMTNPTFFEDPRSLTEFRTIFSYVRSPSDNPLMMGGTIYDFILQGRVSINDRWSLVLHRLGVASVNPGDGALNGYSGGTGITDLQIGAKYTFIRDTRSETLLAAGVSFEIPIGSSSVLAGSGASVVPYLSYGQGFLQNWHFLASTGYRFGYSGGASDFYFLSAHIDYSFFKRFYPFAEVNWFYYTKNGSLQPVNFEGGDLMNIGATQVEGRSLVTLGLGMRYKFTEGFQAGFAYEFPVSGRDMIEDYRLMVDLIFRY